MGKVINTKESYFHYLLSLISDDKVRAADSYYNLCLLFFSTPFEVLNPMDKNRVSDAEELRDLWVESTRVKDERLKQEYAKDLLGIDISFLEVVIALANKVDTQILADPSKPDLTSVMFWDFVDNLVKYGTFGSAYKKASDVLTDDKWCMFTEEAMKASIKKVISRTYHEDGRGGLFPLRKPKINQRKTEMWNCCIAYINENYTD